ncbi:hypothetical protein AAK964_05055 [Tissierella praeacuta]|uniref:hypothetical protein n=1 Tax=Tissierella praeacuta TaxID=43131 RepID=UPI0035133979
MKMGMIIIQGSEKEVRQEFNTLIEKARIGFADAVTIQSEKSFKIQTTDIKITFMLDELFKEYAIYQIIE